MDHESAVFAAEHFSNARHSILETLEITDRSGKCPQPAESENNQHQIEQCSSRNNPFWRIHEDRSGRLTIVPSGTQHLALETRRPPRNERKNEQNSFFFPTESHLRDFVVCNLASIDANGHRLTLYSDKFGKNGIEYTTAVGKIDILAQDEGGNFVIFELKLTHAPDRAIGQILRYMGWVKRCLAGEKSVRGVILTGKANEKLKYAVSIIPGIGLFEYDLRFSLHRPWF